MQPKVSVALAAYNGEKYIRQQLDSIIAQDYPLYEIIIVDDFSKDSTDEILIQYQTTYPDLIRVYFNPENLGYIKNFEKALSLCSADFIALSDQDDIWDADKIRKLLDNMGTNDAIYSDARLIDAESKLLTSSFTEFSGKKTINKHFIDLCINNTVTGCTMMVRKDLVSRAIPFPSCIPHDHWLALLAMDGGGLVYFPEALVSYRQHENNAIGAKPSGTGETNITNNPSRTRREIFRSRYIRYKNLLDGSTKIISSENKKNIKRLYEYYHTYFTKRIRIESFYFHLIHLKAFSYRKTFLQTLNNLFMSCRGLGEKDDS